MALKNHCLEYKYTEECYNIPVLPNTRKSKLPISPLVLMHILLDDLTNEEKNNSKVHSLTLHSEHNLKLAIMGGNPRNHILLLIINRTKIDSSYLSLQIHPAYLA